MLLDSLEEQPEMCAMFVEGATSDEDVIMAKEHGVQPSAHRVHEPMKSLGSVLCTERHAQKPRARTG